MKRDLTIDRPNLTERLYDLYLRSNLAQSTEDVLSARDISRIAKEQGIAWHNLSTRDGVHARFWGAVEDAHWAEL